MHDRPSVTFPLSYLIFFLEKVLLYVTEKRKKKKQLKERVRKEKATVSAATGYIRDAWRSGRLELRDRNTARVTHHIGA